jgi:hypothetical protein
VSAPTTTTSPLDQPQRGSRVRAHTGAWAAATTLAAYWGLNGAGFLLRVVNDPALNVADQLFTRVIWGAWPTIGAVIVARQPRNRIGWLCCGVGFLVGPAFFGQDYAWYTLVHQPGSLPGGLAMGWLGSWPWFIALGLILVFLPLLFPNGQLVSRRWRPVAWIAAAWLVLIWVGVAFSPGPLEGVNHKTVPNPLGIEGAEATFKRLETIAAPGLGLLMLLSVTSMVGRFRRARSAERQQLKWFTYAAAMLPVWFLINRPIQVAFPDLFAVLDALFIAAVPIAAGIAILRYRLYDIDLIINRTLVYGVLSLLLGLIYFGAIVLSQAALRTLAGGESPLAVVASTLAIAALFNPLRQRVQDFIDRRFYRKKYDAAKTLEAFSARLRDETDLDRLGGELVSVVHETMRPEYASLWLRPHGEKQQDERGSDVV